MLSLELSQGDPRSSKQGGNKKTEKPYYTTLYKKSTKRFLTILKSGGGWFPMPINFKVSAPAVESVRVVVHILGC